MAQHVEAGDAMKRIVAGCVTSIIAFNNTALLACPKCRPGVEAGVYNQGFSTNLFILLLPVAVLFVIGIGIHFSDAVMMMLCKHKETQQ
jgi:hypothetical protein